MLFRFIVIGTLLHLQVTEFATAVVIRSGNAEEASGLNLATSKKTRRYAEWLDVVDNYPTSGWNYDIKEPVYHKLRKTSSQRKLYPKGHTDTIIFPTEEQEPQLQLPQHTGSWPFSISNEAILAIVKEFVNDQYKNNPSNPMDSVQANGFETELKLQLGRPPDNPNRYWTENLSFEDYGDIGYNSIIFVGGPRRPACPPGHRRTHRGNCRRVIPIRG